MPHPDTEDALVEQPAIALFAELGRTTVSVLEETFGATGTLLRETKGEGVLVSRSCAALQRVNLALGRLFGCSPLRASARVRHAQNCCVCLCLSRWVCGDGS